MAILVVPTTPFDEGYVPVPTAVIRHATADSDLERVNRLLKSWNEAIEERFGHLRALSAKSPSLELTEMLDSDRKFKDDYKGIITGLRMEISKQRPSFQSLSEEAIAAKTDFYLTEAVKDPVTHAVSTYKIVEPEASSFSKRSLLVGFLVTAPWNLKMHAPNDEETQTLVTPGSGSVLLKSMIEKAFFTKCEFLYLKPLTGSLGFYKHMGMVHNEATDVLHLDLRLKISSVFIKHQNRFLGIEDAVKEE